jgi:hypothetical protein
MFIQNCGDCIAWLSSAHKQMTCVAYPSVVVIGAVHTTSVVLIEPLTTLVLIVVPVGADAILIVTWSIEFGSWAKKVAVRVCPWLTVTVDPSKGDGAMNIGAMLTAHVVVPPQAEQSSLEPQLVVAASGQAQKD